MSLLRTYLRYVAWVLSVYLISGGLSFIAPTFIAFPYAIGCVFAIGHDPLCDFVSGAYGWQTFLSWPMTQLVSVLHMNPVAALFCVLAVGLGIFVALIFDSV